MKLGISITPTGKELLNEMAKTTKLSRSELIERMSRGYISVTSELTNTILTLGFESKSGNSNGSGHEGKFPALKNIEVSQRSADDATPTSAEVAELTQALAEKDKTLTELREKLAVYQKKAATGEALKEEVAQKDDRISELHAQVKELVQSQEAAQQEAQAKQEEAIAVWEQKVAQQEATIAQLQAQVNQLEQSHEVLKHNTVPKGQYEALQSQLQRVDSSRAKETELRSQLHLQQQTIQSLQEKLHQLQQFSSIGEYHLNRWRTHAFYSASRG